jgi:uroporphyrinogen-III synthase
MSLEGLKVVAFESRRSKEIAELVRRHGGEPFVAPALREVPVEGSDAAIDFARRLERGEIDVAVFLTGVGTRLVAQAVAAVLPRDRLRDALAKVVTVARGPKPVAALRELGLAATVTVPEPNTWRDLLAALDARAPVSGKTVAVQEYGEENPDLVAALQNRGARVLRVPVYRWELPEDLRPLRDAIGRLLSGAADVALFTSGSQADHLFRVAAADAPRLRDAFRAVVVASIGPIASAALRRLGVEPDFEPPHPKMGHLVLAAAERARTVLETKRKR